MNPDTAKSGPIRRPALSFGFKLTLAMVLLIAGVCVSTMLILRGQIERNYTEFLRKNFEQQVSMFFENQKGVLKNAREVLLGATHASVRFLAAMESGDNGGVVVDHLYSDLRLQLEGLRRGQRNIIYRVFDAEGHYLEGTREVAEAGITEGQLGAAFAPLVQSAGVNPAAMENAVNYLVLGQPAAPQVYQVITVPVPDRAYNEIVAYLVFAVELDSQTAFGAGIKGQRNGFSLADQRLVSDSLPASLAPELTRIISHQTMDANGDEYTFGGDGQRYLLFSRRLHGSDALPVSVTLYPLGEMLALTSEINWVMISIIPVALLVCLILAAFVSRRFTRPILDLVKGTEAVGRGDFSTRVAVRSRDEVGCLSAAFNEMSADLALKEKYRNVLDCVTDREIAKRLLSGELTLGGEMLEATVLFCDIRGFTTLTEKMDPVEVIGMINTHMSALTTVVHRNHGVVDKFVGDALMAIFGAPKSYGTDANDAVDCALELMAERQRLNALGGHPIQIGIGVATGRVVAGCTGSVDRLNYTVLGDRVNLAARLCSRAPAGEIYIDDNTRAAFKGDSAKVDPLQLELMLKGYTQSIHVFRLHSANPTPTP